jgi:hypothetical protein
MTTLILILFVVGTIILLILMLVDPTSGGLSSFDDAMPGRCPRCGRGDVVSGEGPPVSYTRWYETGPIGHFRCRFCQTGFKIHPNGTLVDDRE